MKGLNAVQISQMREVISKWGGMGDENGNAQTTTTIAMTPRTAERTSRWGQSRGGAELPAESGIEGVSSLAIDVLDVP